MKPLTDDELRDLLEDTYWATALAVTCPRCRRVFAVFRAFPAEDDARPRDVLLMELRRRTREAHVTGWLGWVRSSVECELWRAEPPQLAMTGTLNEISLFMTSEHHCPEVN